MALIKTIAEIRKVIPRLSNLSNNASLPNVDKAGLMWIRPIIGLELYDHLDAKYNGPGPLDANEEKLLNKIHLPLAAYTLLDDLPFLHTTITDNGIRTAQTDNFTAAHRWEFNVLRGALANYAADGVDLLLQYLYKQKDAWPQWTNSDEYKEIDGFLIKTGNDFKKHYPLVQPLRTFWALKPVIEDVEENYFATSLGRDLFAWVKKQPEIIITGDGGEVDVVKFLKKACAHLTIKHAIDTMAVRFDQNGFTVLAGGMPDDENAGKVAAVRAELLKKQEAANREGQNYLSKSMNYLVGIANGVYNNDWGNDFTTAFEHSPLKTDPESKPLTNGNERRRFIRF